MKAKMNSLEMRRQILHIFLGIIFVILLHHGFINKWIILLCITIGFIVSYVSKRTYIPLIHELLRVFERDEYIKKFPGKGTIFYFAGVFFVLLFFSNDIAIPSIMILAFGDSFSHIFGVHLGKIKHPLSNTKFVEGTIAGFIAGFLGAVLFIPWNQAMAASMAAMFVEAIEVKVGAKQIDDNLIMPFVAGAVIFLVRGL